MTAQTRVTNKGRFEQGDAPQGTDYSDLIDSFVSIADTTAQTVASDLIAPNFIASGGVSAVSVNCSALSAVAWTFVSAITTVLTTAQTSAMFTTTANQGAHGVVGLMRVTIGGTSVALMYMHRGTYV